MKQFQIIRLIDGVIVFVQKRESIEDVEIPTGWGLHLEHTVKDENGNDVVVPATCRIVEVVETVEDGRQRDLQNEIHPRFVEAALDYFSGKPESMGKLVEDYEKINLKHPKK